MTTETIETGTEHLLCKVEGHIATLTLNNPSSRNAMSGEMTQAMAEMLPRLADDAAIRVLVVTGAGGAFCSGGDVTGLAESLNPVSGTPDRDMMIKTLRKAQNDLLLPLFNFPKPTVAALPGPAAGAGLGLALACDLRVAVDTTFLTPAFGKIGLSGDFGGSWLLSALLGPARAKEIYFLSKRITAQEALELGLINRVASELEFPSLVGELASELAAQAPLALSRMKANHNLALCTDLETTLDQEAEHMVDTLLSKDHRAAAQAFLQKQNPTFTGR
ncbi:MAG: enoyl-CoA hydratase [Rhodobacteraceae bacterium]|nr:enoyl-CoA hydratase [Paracoccaceae bacterium]